MINPGVSNYLFYKISNNHLVMHFRNKSQKSQEFQAVSPKFHQEDQFFQIIRFSQKSKNLVRNEILGNSGSSANRRSQQGKKNRRNNSRQSGEQVLYSNFQEPLSPTSLSPKLKSGKIKSPDFLKRQYQIIKSKFKKKAISSQQIFQQLDCLIQGSMNKNSYNIVRQQEKPQKSLKVIYQNRSQVEQLIFERSERQYPISFYDQPFQTAIQEKQVYQNLIFQKQQIIDQLQKTIEKQRVLLLKQIKQKQLSQKKWEQEKTKLKCALQQHLYSIVQNLQKEIGFLKENISQTQKQKELFKQIEKVNQNLETKNKQLERKIDLERNKNCHQKKLVQDMKSQQAQLLTENMQLKKQLEAMQKQVQFRVAQIGQLTEQLTQQKLKVNILNKNLQNQKEKYAKMRQQKNKYFILSKKNSRNGIPDVSYSTISDEKSYSEKKIKNSIDINKSLIKANVNLQIQVHQLKRSLSKSKFAFSQVLQKLSQIQQSYTNHQITSKKNKKPHEKCIQQIGSPINKVQQKYYSD